MKLLIRSVVASLCSMCFCMSAGAAAAAIETTAGGADWNAVIAWAAIASTALSVGSGLYTWLSNRDRVTAKRFDDQHKDFDKRFTELEREQHKLELKVKELEGKLNAMPTNVQMGELYRNVAEIDGDMKAANATLKGIDTRMQSFETIAGRIEKFLLNQAEEKGRKR